VPKRLPWPLIITACADCGRGCHGLHEWYMVNDEIWNQAWSGRRKSWHHLIPGQEILCIGCLERRIGRTLTASDFIPDVLCNDPKQKHISERLRDRLTATNSRRLRGRPKGSKNKPKTPTDGRGDASPHRYLDEAPPM
jgi:hypothetical protein